MLFLNTIKHSSGEVLTGRLWRKESTLFSNLPFHSNILRMDEIGGPLQEALSNCSSEEWQSAVLVVSNVTIINGILKKYFLQKIGTGLDIVHPFSDTTGVSVVLREAEAIILSSDLQAVGKNNASRIWGLLSKYVMLDRFGKALGVADIHPNIPVPKIIVSNNDLGHATKVHHFHKQLDFLTRF